MPCKAQAPFSFGYFRGGTTSSTFFCELSNVHPWMRLSSREEGSGGLTERGLWHTATLSHLPRKQASPTIQLHLSPTCSPAPAPCLHRFSGSILSNRFCSLAHLQYLSQTPVPAQFPSSSPAYLQNYLPTWPPENLPSLHLLLLNLLSHPPFPANFHESNLSFIKLTLRSDPTSS